MKNLIFFITFLILSSGNLFSQISLKSNSFSTGFTWQETFGDTGVDKATCMIKTSENGFAVAGYTYSYGSGNVGICILNLKQDGSYRWGKLLNSGRGDIANSLIQTSDSGFILAGATNSHGLDFFEDMYLVKLDSKGELQWAKTFGTNGWDNAYTITQTSDNGYIVTGYSRISSSEYGLLIVKFSETGYIEWSKLAEKVSNGLVTSSLIQTIDYGYGIAGTLYTVSDNSDICFIKLNSLGMLQWSWLIGGSNDEQPFSVCQTVDNGYAIAGYTNTYGAGYPDLYIVKLAITGNIQWTRTIGGDNDDYALSIMNTPEGGFIVGGESFTFGSGWIDMFLVKLDNNGRYIWGKTIGSSEMDFIRSVVYDNDNGFVAVGNTEAYNSGYSDMYIVKTDPLGNACGNTTTPVPHIDSGGTINKYPVNIYDIPTLLLSVNTNITDWGNITNLCFTGLSSNSGELPLLFSLHQNYPNPFNPVTKIEFDIPKQSFAKIIIYDLIGHEVTTLVNEQLKPGSYSVDWDGTGFASGVYFYSLITNEFTETKRMVLIK